MPFSTLTDSVATGSDATTYTFSARNLGTADANRYIVVGVGHRSASTRTGFTCSVAGVSATLIASRTVGPVSSGIHYAHLFLAHVPTGTSGDIVFSSSGSSLRCGIAVWALDNPNTTPTDTAEVTSSAGTTPATADITVAAGGAAFAVTTTVSAPASISWTNLTGDAFYTGGTYESGNFVAFASANFASAQTELTMTATTPTSVNSAAGVFASFAPAGGGGDGNGSGATLTVTASLPAGTATGSAEVGASLLAASTLVLGGTGLGDAALTGATLTLAVSLLEGEASPGAVPGSLLTVAVSSLDGAPTTGSSVVGSTVSAAFSVVSGGAMGGGPGSLAMQAFRSDPNATIVLDLGAVGLTSTGRLVHLL